MPARLILTKRKMWFSTSLSLIMFQLCVPVALTCSLFDTGKHQRIKKNKPWRGMFSFHHYEYQGMVQRLNKSFENIQKDLKPSVKCS